MGEGGAVGLCDPLGVPLGDAVALTVPLGVPIAEAVGVGEGVGAGNGDAVGAPLSEEPIVAEGEGVTGGEGVPEGVAVAQGLGEGLPLPSHVPRIATLSTRSDDAVKLKAVSAQQNPVGERSASGGKSTEKGSRRGLGYRRLLFAPYVVKARVLLGVCAATTQGVAFTAFAVE